MATKTDRAKARHIDRQRAVFRELVETEDHMLLHRLRAAPSRATLAAAVGCARRAVRDAHGLNDLEMSRIVERGLAEEWPPLGVQ